MTDAARPRLWPAAAPLLPAVALIAIVLALLFGPEIVSAVRVWNSSTAYGHCWLVLPIALWLLYERRAQTAAQPTAPAFWPAVLVLPLLGLWVAADLLGIMEGRQIAVVGVAEAALLAALGPRQWWAASAALLYLIFLVPFGAFLTPVLQDFTAAFVAHGLNLLGVPNRVTQFQIEIPEGNFYVAEACAGLRFLIASIAFGVLYAVTMFRSPRRRAAYIAVACIVPVLANGLRGLGIVMLGHVLGSAEAAATDHVLYGWIFFSLVIVALAAAGMPFRQDPASAPRQIGAPRPGTAVRAALCVLPVLLVAALGPAASLLLDARAQPAGQAPHLLVAGPGCILTEVRPDHAVLMQTFRCGNAILLARTAILPRRANPSWVVKAGADWTVAMVPGHDVDGRLLAIDGADPMTWALSIDTDSGRAAAYLLFVDGRPSLGGLRDRWRLARDLLHGSGDAPITIAVAVINDDADSADTLRRFLRGQGDLLNRIRKAVLF